MTRFCFALLLLLPAIAHAQRTDADSPARILLGAEQRAIDIVLASARSDSAAIRANAIEAIQHRPERALPLIQLGLEDRNPAVRFVALVTAGKLRISAVEDAARRLLEDPNDSVKAAAIFALHRIGAPVDISPLAGLLARPDATTRGNVAMLLGQMGEPSAANMLVDLGGLTIPRESPARLALVRLQVAEAVVQLGDESGMAAIRAAMFSEFDEVRVLAVMMVGRLKDRRAQTTLGQMLTQNPQELALAAAGSLAQLGMDNGLSVALNASQSPTSTLRSQAAFVLRQFSSADAARALVRLLDDPDPAVRIAAAAAVLAPPQSPGVRAAIGR